MMSTLDEDCSAQSISTTIALVANKKAKFKFARVEWLSHNECLVARAEIPSIINSVELISLALRSVLEHQYLYELETLIQSTVNNSQMYEVITESEAEIFVNKKHDWIYDMTSTWVPDSRMHEMNVELQEKQQAILVEQRIIDSASTAGEFLQSGDANGQLKLNNVLKSVESQGVPELQDKLYSEIALKVACAGVDVTKDAIRRISNPRQRVISYANIASTFTSEMDACKLIEAAKEEALKDDDAFHSCRGLLAVAQAYATFNTDAARNEFSAAIENAALVLNKEDYALFSAECQHVLNNSFESKETCEKFKSEYAEYFI